MRRRERSDRSNSSDMRRHDKKTKHDPFHTPVFERLLMNPAFVTAVYVLIAVVAALVFAGMTVTWKLVVSSQTMEQRNVALVKTTLEVLARSEARSKAYVDSVANAHKSKACDCGPEEACFNCCEREAMQASSDTAGETCRGEGDFCYDELDSMAHAGAHLESAAKAIKKQFQENKQARSTGTNTDLFSHVSVTLPLPPRREPRSFSIGERSSRDNEPARSVCLRGVIVLDVMESDDDTQLVLAQSANDDYTQQIALDGNGATVLSQFFIHDDQKIVVLGKLSPDRVAPKQCGDMWEVGIGARGSAGVVDEATGAAVYISNDELVTVLSPFLNRDLTVKAAALLLRDRVHDRPQKPRSVVPVRDYYQLDEPEAELVTRYEATDKGDVDEDDDSQLSFADDLNEPARGDIVIAEELSGATSVGAGRYGFESEQSDVTKV